MTTLFIKFTMFWKLVLFSASLWSVAGQNSVFFLGGWWLWTAVVLISIDYLGIEMELISETSWLQLIKKPWMR